MNEEQKDRYSELKAKNLQRNREISWQKDPLFRECLESLHDYQLFTLKETEDIFSMFEQNFPISLQGYINWDEFSGVQCEKTERSLYNETEEKYYILWDKQDIPCVMCDLRSILHCLDDVLAVSFNMWLLSIDGKEVIEFHHEGMITYGRIV